LQKRVGLQAPTPFRDYLMEVGLFQDLTWGGPSPIELYDEPSEFVLARKFLQDILPSNKAEFFPFGDDGAGNVYCLPAGDKTPCRIHFVDHETAKVSKRKDFTEWLQAVVAKVLRGIRRRPLNDRKAWCVQFSFAKTSYAELEKLLSSAGKLKAIDKDWKNPEKTGGVKSAERRLEWNGQPLKVAGWNARSGTLLSSHSTWTNRCTTASSVRRFECLTHSLNQSARATGSLITDRSI